jgi:GTP-binding protein
LDGASPHPLQDFQAINEELELFSPELARKPQIVALNKMDLPQAEEAWPAVRDAMQERNLPVHAISAATGQATRELLYAALNLVESMPLEPPATVESRVLRPAEDESSFVVLREGDHFRVRGRRVERTAVMTDWNNREAVARFQRILDAMGVFEALRKAGIQPGDTVFVGESDLEWR